MKNEIKKNLLDLEYSKYLNYLILVLIIMATFLITLWFAKDININKDYATLISIAMGILIWYSIHYKLDKIKEEIKKIKK